MTTRIALIAHDHKKEAIVQLAGEYVDTLRRCDIVATGTTGSRRRSEIHTSNSLITDNLYVDRKDHGQGNSF